MSDIDFLANKKPADDQKPKNQGDKKEKIIWSEPDKDKPIIKRAPFSLFSFLGRKKEAEKPVSAAASAGSAIDKNKIKESRREILKLIKHNENLSASRRTKENRRPGKGFLAGLIEKFKKQPSHKETLIDYQQVFNREKIKRGLPVRLASLAGSPRLVGEAGAPARRSGGQAGLQPASPPVSIHQRRGGSLGGRNGKADPVKQIFSIRPVVEKKLAPAQRAKASGDSFLSRFFKTIKDKMASWSWPKPRPAKTNLSGIIKKAEPKIVQPPRAEPVRFARPAEAPPRPPRLGEPEARQEAGAAPLAYQRSARGFGEVKAAAKTEPVKLAREEKEEPIEREKTARLAASLAESSPRPGQVEAGRREALPAQAGPARPVQIQAEAPKVLETNLIKGEIITFFDWRKKIITLINAIVIPVFFVAVIYFGLISYQKFNQAKVQEQTKKFDALTEEIKQAEVDLKEITEFQARLKIVSQIFAGHIYWTNFFKFLEDNTIKDVYYAGFAGDTNGEYSFDATALKFSDIPEQIGVLKNNQKITAVQTAGGEAITSGTADNKTGVKFSLKFSILKSIFTE